MKTFKDNEGREWTIQLHCAAVKRVRDLAKVDLMGILDGQLAHQLARDPVMLCDVLYAACKPQADERKLTDEDFGRALAGDVLDAAVAALLEEVANFLPNPKDRQIAGDLILATGQAMDRARDWIGERMRSGAIQAEVERRLASALPTAGDYSTPAPESSESTRPA